MHHKMIWQPSATKASLVARAQCLERVRAFFKARDVLEVDTPLLCSSTNPDLHLDSLSVEVLLPGKQRPSRYYLQTSPEFAMKRLLAAGLGPIFQIAKAFRGGESGPLHNPEFTLLEWYQPGYSLMDLMDESDELLFAVAALPKAQRLSYQSLFETHIGLNPHTASADDLKAAACRLGKGAVQGIDGDKDAWLHYLMSTLIEPCLGHESPVFVYNFPASQASLAQIKEVDGHSVARRFEIYIKGVELANGFAELVDEPEQRKRFEAQLAQRTQQALPTYPIDERFLSALASGLAPTSGIALGIDRLVMVILGYTRLEAVLPFLTTEA